MLYRGKSSQERSKVLPAIAEGQVSATDRLILTKARYKDEGRYVVLFDLGSR